MTFAALVAELERIIKLGPGGDYDGYMLALGSVVGRYTADLQTEVQRLRKLRNQTDRQA